MRYRSQWRDRPDLHRLPVPSIKSHYRRDNTTVNGIASDCTRVSDSSGDTRSMPARLTLICHGATAATRASAFPLDEPLEEGVEEQARKIKRLVEEADSDVDKLNEELDDAINIVEKKS